ncbi:hypothetical protein [Microbacterium rhizomatis]|uniref:Uncharacterized protein n=1 Tax=Microbacterium rhizomatis TaxID=1631477 RepID=A0A5J5IY39_9MICO|nr:hypothetical protein [Microbacterium rhizomatis]KAA9104982.1 hypothetical protein F6B43_18205 [Microbacterium rhizomatis]
MMILTYAGTELMTGDALARAVLEYCAALAEEGAAETLEIPVLRLDGSMATATLVVGPASQIVAMTVDTTFPELEDAATLDHLMTRTRAHRPVLRASATPPVAEIGEV